jgi:RNAse (barnase) inhibitor barstar
VSENPFAPRPEFKKRVITVSLTKEQDEMFELLKAKLELSSDGAVIKRGLEELWDMVMV